MHCEVCVHIKTCSHCCVTCYNISSCTKCANKKQSLRKNIISVTVKDFFTKFTAFTEEDAHHIRSKFHHNICYGFKNYNHLNLQVALLWQRDRATRLSVEILQLQNIPFEN